MQDIRVIFLGTSAGMPTRARNVASVAVMMDGRALLFDCGEGTQHQLMRSAVRFGAIEAIFLSHLHGDHLFGLPGLLASMSLNAREKPLALYGPAGVAEFMRALPLYHEDDFALYVHAGLEDGKHPRDSSPHALLWTRDTEFYKNYHGKPCVFGHTPTPFLPLRGRLGRHGIYLHNSAIGIDTGYNIYSPLSCLSLPDFTLYQSFADGHTATHHITMMIPETLREMQRKAAAHS